MTMIALNDIQSWLNGEKLRSDTFRKQYKLIALIVVLIFIYILAGYHSIEQQKRLGDLREQVRDAKFEYLTISAVRVEVTRQSQIVRHLQEAGSELQENRKPPIRIE